MRILAADGPRVPRRKRGSLAAQRYATRRSQLARDSGAVPQPGICPPPPGSAVRITPPGRRPSRFSSNFTACAAPRRLSETLARGPSPPPPRRPSISEGEGALAAPSRVAMRPSRRQKRAETCARSSRDPNHALCRIGASCSRVYRLPLAADGAMPGSMAQQHQCRTANLDAGFFGEQRTCDGSQGGGGGGGGGVSRARARAPPARVSIGLSGASGQGGDRLAGVGGACGSGGGGGGGGGGSGGRVCARAPPKRVGMREFVSPPPPSPPSSPPLYSGSSSSVGQLYTAELGGAPIAAAAIVWPGGGHVVGPWQDAGSGVVGRAPLVHVSCCRLPQARRSLAAPSVAGRTTRGRAGPGAG
jgi:hypothetical protein